MEKSRSFFELYKNGFPKKHTNIKNINMRFRCWNICRICTPCPR